jgi:Predicted transcriptional regulator
MTTKIEGLNLRNWRRDHNLTQKEVALYLEVPVNTVARWERGDLTIEREHMLCLCLEHYELRAENKALQDQAFDLTERLHQASAEVEWLRAALEHIRNVATSAALGLDDGIDHRWYIEEVARVLARPKEC